MSCWNAGRLQTAVLVAIPILFAACQWKPEASATGTDHAKTAKTEQTKPVQTQEDLARMWEEAAPASSIDEQRKTNEWRRMKECSEQADRVEKRWAAPDVAGEETSWSNHYSPKYNKCYVLSESKGKERQTLHLGDAFEGKTMAMCSESGAGSSFKFCAAPGISDDDCNACRQYIYDHMQN